MCMVFVDPVELQHGIMMQMKLHDDDGVVDLYPLSLFHIVEVHTDLDFVDGAVFLSIQSRPN